MTSLQFLHLFFIAMWAGCVLVELVVEVRGYRDPELAASAARMHYSIDLFVEIPIFLAVLITGILLIDPSRFSPLYFTKIGAGLIAIVANIYCVIPVILRHQALKEGNSQKVRTYTKMVFGAFFGVPFGLVAFFIGLSFLGLY